MPEGHVRFQAQPGAGTQDRDRLRQGGPEPEPRGDGLRPRGPEPEPKEGDTGSQRQTRS